MLHNAVLNTVGLVLYFFAQWLTTVLAVRFGNFDTAGVYSVVISYCNIFYYLALFGIRNYQISDINEQYSQSQYSGARILCAVVALLLCTVLTIIKRNTGYVTGCYLIYMLFKLGEAYTDGYFSVLQTQRRYGKILTSYVLKAFFPLAAFTIPLFRSGSILNAILAMTITYFLMVLLDLFDQYAYKAPKPEIQGCWGILRQCLPLFLMSLTLPMMNYMTRHAVEIELGFYSLGQYASLSSVIVIMSTMAGAVFLVLIPEVSEWRFKGESGRIIKLFTVIVVLCVVVGCIAVFLGKTLGDLICSAIFGKSILESIDLLIPLLITSTVLMIKSFFSCMLVPLERKGLLLIGELAGMGLCLLTAFPFTRRWGLYGANYSFMLGVVLQLVLLGSFCVVAVMKNKGKGERQP